MTRRERAEAAIQAANNPDFHLLSDARWHLIREAWKDIEADYLAALAVVDAAKKVVKNAALVCDEECELEIAINTYEAGQDQSR